MEKITRPPPTPDSPNPLHAIEDRGEPLTKFGYQGVGVGTSYLTIGRAPPCMEENTRKPPTHFTTPRGGPLDQEKIATKYGQAPPTGTWLTHTLLTHQPT